jgi:hypothetical protein
MSRCVFALLLLLLLSAAFLLVPMDACGGSGSGIPPGKIQHVVVVIQENRTPDNLFHDPVLMARGADIASSGTNSAGTTIPLEPTPLGIDYDLAHTHFAFVDMRRQDGWSRQDSGLLPCPWVS